MEITKNKLLKLFWLTLTIIIITITLFWLLTPQPIPVNVAKATYGKYIQTVDDDGKTRAKEIYEITAPVSGKLLRIKLKEGNIIKQNSIIAVIQPSPSSLQTLRTEQELQQQLGSAEASYNQAYAQANAAKAALDVAQLDLNRKTPLANKGYISKSEFEHITLEYQLKEKEYESALSNLHAAEHVVAKAKASLLQTKYETVNPNNQLEIRSPVYGQVLRIPEKSENVVTTGTHLLDIADISNLEVVTDILSTDAPQIPPHAKVFIMNWGGSGILEGQVRVIEPSAFTKISALGIEEQRVNVISNITSPYNLWKTLGDGYRVDTQIVVFQSENVLRVPMSAVFRDGNNWAVYVIKQNKAYKQAVTIHWHNAQMAVIQKGLNDGDMVILYPGDKIHDGVRITILPD